MKILFLARSLEIGGAERQLVALASGLHQKGHSILVVTLYPGGPLELDLRDRGVAVTTLNKAGRWAMFSFLRRLVSLTRREAPDVLHGYLPFPNLLTIVLKRLFPKIKIVWGVRASNMDFAHYDWFWPLLFRVVCFFSRYADLIIVNSTAGREYHVRQGFPEEKMVIIPNGIDTTCFRPEVGGRILKRAEWGIGNSEKVVGLVARVDPMKDHFTFLRAAAIVAKQMDDVRFVCVGDGPEPYKSKVRQFAADLELDSRVIWTGSCKDMMAVYNGFDLAVSSSAFGEGFPNAVGEAMACGVPCVATDVGDSALIINDARLMVTPGHPEALASVIRSALSLTSQESARKRIETHFSVARLVDRTEAVLNAVCAARTDEETVSV
jgi:glycosyltransferase involved in cell wall biosynthesis